MLRKNRLVVFLSVVGAISVTIFWMKQWQNVFFVLLILAWLLIDRLYHFKAKFYWLISLGLILVSVALAVLTKELEAERLAFWVFTFLLIASFKDLSDR